MPRSFFTVNIFFDKGVLRRALVSLARSMYDDANPLKKVLIIKNTKSLCHVIIYCYLCTRF
jgi:hypothetical protein